MNTSKHTRRLVPKVTLVMLLLGAGVMPLARAQSVAVLARLDVSVIPVGGVTTLHVEARVVPELRENADRIFSWYVDVLNTNGAAAAAGYATMAKTASDQDPQIASTGFADGANRRGIFDTFLNLPGAGVSNQVELMAIPVTGLAPGRTRFRVQAGTGIPYLGHDFIVAPTGGGDPFTGGDYGAAFADLIVVSECSPQLSLVPLDGSGPTAGWSLRFAPCPGYNHTVEYLDQLGSGQAWQPLAGAPHNSGNLTVANVIGGRFYRVRAARP